MNVLPMEIPEVLVVEPTIHGDDRGFFFESYSRRQFAQVGVADEFVQDNHSRSARNVLRGLHYQVQRPQGKLVRVVAGAIFDVAVDIRRRSPTFGKWVGLELSAQNRRMVWIPVGFAHGFLALSEHAECLYETTDYWAPKHERCIAWNDPDIGIVWPLKGVPMLSGKDMQGMRLREAEVFD